ncbi:hypothetical protein [Planktothrix mougeotii]|uniref:Uncharacterized protein n=1 Tax=Planktothrix mougeotii LEGE 06226 TaxID=1828728 RepID=A0ABR9UEM9_9CYAN|nr:hypothetical protein [Planktothrix mougeotii]MBE9144924.1 hypothetical protein [Planktothrix mougeotii LEGE 06226]
MGKLLNAIVKYPAGKILETKYGEKVNAVFMAGEEEIKIWADANTQKAEMLKSLVKGEHKLILDDGGKYKLLEDEQKTQPNGNTNSNDNGKTNGKTNSNYEPLSDDKKRAIGQFITEQADLLAFCHETAYKAYNKRFPHDPMDESESFALDSETIQKAGMSLFITTQKRFGI